MARNVVLSKTLAAADDNGIATSQSPAGAGDLTLDGVLVSGGVATLDTGRRVIVTSGGDDTGITFTIYGTTESGTAISEAITGANAGAAATSLDFKTVTRVAISAASAGTVIVGTNGVGATPWQPVNRAIVAMNVGFGVVVSGTVNYTVQYTYDDVIADASTVPTAWNLSSLASKAVDTDGNIASPFFAWRLLVNSGTGTATITAIQAGITNQ